VLVTNPVGVPIGSDVFTSATRREEFATAIVKLVKKLQPIHRFYVHRDLRLANLVWVRIGNGRELMQIEWGFAAEVGTAYLPKDVFPGSNEFYLPKASDDLRTLLRVLFARKFSNVWSQHCKDGTFTENEQWAKSGAADAGTAALNGDYEAFAAALRRMVLFNIKAPKV